VQWERVAVRYACLLLVVTAMSATAESIVIQTDLVRLEVADDATLVSLTAPGSEAELGQPGEPVAYAKGGEGTVTATRAITEGDSVTLVFGDSGVSAGLSWSEEDGLASTVAMIPAEQACWIHAGAGRLIASVAREVSLGPVRMALMAAPADQIADRIQQAEELFGIPLGIKAKRSDAARGTYLMIGGVSADNADEVIDWARRGGFGSILLLHGTWGHFGRHYEVPKSYFPGGIEQLRDVVDRIHEAGLLAGAHMFSRAASSSFATWWTASTRPGCSRARTCSRRRCPRRRSTPRAPPTTASGRTWPSHSRSPSMRRPTGSLPPSRPRSGR